MLDSSMKGLSETLHAAFYNRDANAQMSLKALGIDWRDEHGNITKTEDALGKLADKAASYKDKATAARALASVGVDKDLFPLLQKEQAGLDEFVRRARHTGAVMTEEMAEDAKKLNASWTELGMAIEGVTNNIEKDWSPTATHAMDTISHWIEKNQALAKSYTEIGSVITGLGLLKPAAWLLRLLGLGVVPKVASRVAPLALPLTLSGDTGPDPDKDAREAAQKKGGKAWEDWQEAHPNPFVVWWRKFTGQGNDGDSPQSTAGTLPPATAAALDRRRPKFDWRERGWRGCLPSCRYSVEPASQPAQSALRGANRSNPDRQRVRGLRQR